MKFRNTDLRQKWNVQPVIVIVGVLVVAGLIVKLFVEVRSLLVISKFAPTSLKLSSIKNLTALVTPKLFNSVIAAASVAKSLWMCALRNIIITRKCIFRIYTSKFIRTNIRCWCISCLSVNVGCYSNDRCSC